MKSNIRPTWAWGPAVVNGVFPVCGQRFAAEESNWSEMPLPGAPLSNQLTLGEIAPAKKGDTYLVANGIPSRRIEVSALIAGGGIAGSSLFRYMAEAGMNPILVNADRGSSWRNIGGGRTAFSYPNWQK